MDRKILSIKDVTELAYEAQRHYLRTQGKHLYEWSKLPEDEQVAWLNRALYQVKCPNVGPYGNRIEPNLWHAQDGIIKTSDTLFHRVVGMFVGQPEFFGVELKAK